MNHKLYMERALALAALGTGQVSPNPLVGCVIVKNGKIIGEGWHSRHGAPHAEREALAKATESVAGATLYVNLEPCNHRGKTPPCTEAIIEHKIAKVVFAMSDPNPQAQGGEQRLREAGIEVEKGILEDEARWLNRYFIKFVTTKRPYVVAKIAQSIDGCVATGYGESKWITCEESRRHVHIMRSQIDAVVVGEITVAKDDPQLTVRDVEGRNPWRVVLDSDLSIPLRMKVFMLPDRNKTIVACKAEAAATKKADTLRLAGVKILALHRPTPVSLDLNEFLEEAAAQFGVNSILVEGGARVFSAFMKDDIIDELHLFVAPKILGNGKQVFGSLAVPSLRLAKQFQYRSVIRSGDDLHVIATKAEKKPN